MFANIKLRLASVISPDIPALPSIHDQQQAARGYTQYHQRILQQSQLQDKFAYSRPPFLQLLTPDELKASADHNVRPIIVPRDITLLPWGTGYAECVNSGKSEWNEDQGAFCRQVLSDPTHKYPDLPYTYFGIFDGHAGYGAALAASYQFQHILHEKLIDCIDFLLPREGMEDINNAPAGKPQSVDSFPHPSHYQKPVSKDDVIIGALESAFIHMDSLIAQDRDRYRDAGGCTACVSLFINGKMYVANAGDSRAVLCQRKFTDKRSKGDNVETDGTEGAFPEPFSFDHTPETERTRLLAVAQYKPRLMGIFYTAMEYAKRPQVCDLGQRILCRQGTNKGWTYKTLTRDDLKMPVVTGEGKRSRLLGTLGVTRGFGDHDLLAIATGIPIKPFLTAQPEVNYRDLTKIVSIPDENNEDGDYGILVMATDGLWDVSENEAVARTVFRTLHKYPTEKHRYTMVAQELVAKARGKINDYRHWRLADSKAAATVDDISVMVIPVYQYYKEHIEYEQKCLREHRERLERASMAQACEAKEEESDQHEQQQQEEINGLVNGIQGIAHVEDEPELCTEEKQENSADEINSSNDEITENDKNKVEKTALKEDIITEDDMDEQDMEIINDVVIEEQEDKSPKKLPSGPAKTKQEQRKSQRKDKR